MISIAIIGIGHWGRNLIRDFSKFCEVSYCFGKGNPENLAWVQNNFPQIKIAESIEQVLNGRKVDAVIVATPVGAHYQIAKKALLANKHVFLEKPPTTSAKQSAELLRIAKQKKVLIFTDNTFYYHPVFTKLKVFLKDKTVFSAESIWLKYGTFKEDLLFNLFYHDAYLFIELFGKPLSITSFHKRKNSLYVELDFHENLRAVIFMDRNFNGHATKLMSFNLKGGSLVWSDGQLINYGASKNLQIVKDKNNLSPLELCIKSFLEEIREKKLNYDNFDLSIKTVELIERVKSFKIL